MATIATTDRLDCLCTECRAVLRERHPSLFPSGLSASSSESPSSSSESSSSSSESADDRYRGDLSARQWRRAQECGAGEFIGRGTFASAYRDSARADGVILVVRDDRDISRDVYVAARALSPTAAPHIPPFEVLYAGDDCTVYRTEYTETPGDHGAAAETGDSLWDGFREVGYDLRAFAREIITAAQIARGRARSHLRQAGTVHAGSRAAAESSPASLVLAVALIARTAVRMMPDTTWYMEFPARNLGVTRDGAVVLRDVLFTWDSRH